MERICLVWCVALGACAASAKQDMAMGGSTMPAPVSAVDESTTGSGGGGGASLPDEKLVITGSISLEVDDGEKAVTAIKSAVDGVKGRVVLDDETGGDRSWSAHLTVRLPPGDAQKFIDEVSKVGDVVSRSVQASDVSREYFDQEIALKNLHLTLDRLQALLGGPDLKTADVLQIEQELTRVRGQIEQLEGDHQFLEDRVDFATLDLYVSSTGTHLLAPKAHLYPGARAALLYLMDAPDGQEKVRVGASAVVWFMRQSYLELEIYPSRDDTGRAVIATAGGDAYSDFLGGGKRRYGNAFLGGRIGYGYVGGHHEFVAGGELGMELVKTDHVIVEAAVRGLGLFGKGGVDAALEGTVGLQIPF